MSPEAPALLEAGSFAVGRCRECAREVVTYPDWEGEVEVRRCLHCDGRLGDLRRVDAGELEALGYAVRLPDEPDGGGCASCATGGCGVREEPSA